MPTFARNFSEGMITDEANEHFNYIIAEWIEAKLHEMYVNALNMKSEQSTQQPIQSFIQELGQMELNIKAYIERMIDKYNIYTSMQDGRSQKSLKKSTAGLEELEEASENDESSNSNDEDYEESSSSSNSDKEDGSKHDDESK